MYIGIQAVQKKSLITMKGIHNEITHTHTQ